jgi:ATP-dependent exoDNAse (exonuclease V) beta subunit
VAEGVERYAEVVTALVRSALASEMVQRAAARRHWREMYVGTVQDDGTVVEGYVDLIYEEDDGSLVIVDYKTDAIPAGAVDSRVEYYAPQLRAYARMLGEATAAGPVEARIAFLGPSTSHVAAV